MSPNKNILDRFSRVNPRRPCPVCERTDWCLFEPDDSGSPTSAICCRVQSPRLWGAAGWFHALTGNYFRPERRRWKVTPPKSCDLVSLDRRLRLARDGFVRDPTAAQIALDLGVTQVSLRRIRAGLEGKTLIFPMYDGQERLVGARLRSEFGHRSVPGGRNGLFLPSDRRPLARLYVAEGPTDTAALLTLGVDAIGRPCALGGVEFVMDFVGFTTPLEVIVVADADEPGRLGALKLAANLVVKNRAVVRIIEPPAGHKDVRAWVRCGATASDLDALVANASTLKLTDARRHCR
jgi:hypothetical protein